MADDNIAVAFLAAGIVVMVVVALAMAIIRVRLKRELAQADP